MDNLAAWPHALQSVDLVAALRASRWAYPLVNAMHIIGIALLFGAIVPLDLRLLGLWRSLPVAFVARVALPVSITGLILTLTAGGLLFSVSAVKYVAMPLFLTKMGLIVLALANASYLLRTGTVERQSSSGRAWIAAALSIVLWVTVIICGRMIAYV